MLRSLIVSTLALHAYASSFGSDADSLPDPASLISKKPTSRSGSPDQLQGEVPDFQTYLTSYVISKAPLGKSTLVKGSTGERKPERTGHLAQLLAGLRTSESSHIPSENITSDASTEAPSNSEQEETTPAP
jgi:hypothetical protein